MSLTGFLNTSLPFLLKGLFATIYLALISGVFAMIIGIVVGGFCVRSKIFIIRKLTALYVAIFRGTPILSHLFIAYFVLPSFGIRLERWQAAVIAISIYNGAYITEIVRSGIEAIPKGQTEAALSMGMNHFLKMKLIIFPQAIRIIIPSLVGQLILLVKSTSIVSLIGVFDLLKSGKELINASGWNPLIMYSIVAFFYFIVLYPLYVLSIRIEGKLKISYKIKRELT